VALAHIARKPVPPDVEGLIRRGGQAHHRLCFRGHLLERGTDGRRVERREPLVAAAHHLVGGRRQQHSDGRPYAGVGRHHYPLDAQLGG